MKQVVTRMTKQRKVILEELRKVKTHPCAEELYELVRSRMPKVSLGTVYRNLDFLANTGEVKVLSSGGTTRRYDGDTSDHAHVRCLECGSVGDVFCNTQTKPVEGIASQGFVVVSSRIEYDGYCEACLRREVDTARRCV